MATISSGTLIGIPDEVDNTYDDPRERAPLVTNGRSFSDVTRIVTSAHERPIPKAWYVCMAVTLSLLTVLSATLGMLLSTGVGVWGNNSPTAWGWPIVNFVFWVGIGHAGTLISAILFLFRQNWRTSINRFSEAMTIFAVICAAMYPGIHIGRPWLAYWLFPIPNQMGMWPQFRSPLEWDVFAVGTYFTVSLMFWYVGMVPDMATMRDRAKSKFEYYAYAFFSLGWTGSSRHWHRYERDVPLALRPVHAARAQRSLGRVVRFRDVAVARVAHDDLPALLRGRRDLRRLRDGANARDPVP